MSPIDVERNPRSRISAAACSRTCSFVDPVFGRGLAFAMRDAPVPGDGPTGPLEQPPVLESRSRIPTPGANPPSRNGIGGRGGAPAPMDRAPDAPRETPA